MIRMQWTALVVLGVAGAAGYLAFAHTRAGVSYACGVLIAGLALTGSIAAVRWADRVTPALSMIVALMTYAMIVAVLAAILASSDPKVVDGPAFALGLVVAAVVWVLGQLRAARPGNGS